MFAFRLNEFSNYSDETVEKIVSEFKRVGLVEGPEDIYCKRTKRKVKKSSCTSCFFLRILVLQPCITVFIILCTFAVVTGIN